MANIILPPGWQGRDADCTDRAVYVNRRRFIKQLGLGSIGVTAVPGLLTACADESQTRVNAPEGPLDTIPANAPRFGLPAARNAEFKVPERPLTDRLMASSYTNFYEFRHSGMNQKIAWPLTGDYKPFPWTIQVSGLVEKPFKIGIEDLMKEMGLEERVYRFRCVEAWSMTIPWVGFPLAKLINRCKPLSSATHVRFVSTNRPDEMPGLKSSNWYPWPYYEGLRMDEALNELAFIATGMYGEPLPKQNGSPLRMVLPWKYGYKGAKAIEKIEFVDKQPPTFWSDLQPTEYPFLSNVNPNVPHPRWSQASERFIHSENREERVQTQLFNGYAAWVGDLYPKEPR